ncbi:Pyrroline-5-carboxylate reductase 1, mitochondrial [Phytophthora boehmeriae]|uniref:Pyrroline-5-carboxylate reductase 1, mitochondrial n=1 Tax=Phytophthora boehmeriae TaxID=109152 RepID=A0A8T1VNS4_9STRA|nr:Pyrroline-5-carboxylate reductase 1, mitochondrial [Phytophthora boehmeriae]
MTLLASGYRAAHVALSTRQPDRIPRCDALRAPSALPLLQSVPRYYDNARLARESDVLVLCMPPSQLKSVAIQVRHALAANVEAPPLVISALCGVTLQSLTKACGSQAVVRVQPDVAEIARQWQCPKDEEGQAQSLCGATATLPVVELTAIQQESAERSRQQRLPLRLAAEALAPHREDVRELYHAFVLFARRVSDQEGKLAEVLFGQQSDVVMAALDSHADDERQKQQKTAVETPSWPVEWEQDLAELQTRLAEHALE